MADAASAPATQSLGRGAALITIATAASRVTGFLRVVAVAAAMGTTYLANTYNSANTAPNLVFELVAAGILSGIFVPTFVDYIVKNQREKGWEAADALTSVAIVGLTAVALALGLLAPWIMRLLLIGADADVKDASIALGTDLLRLFAPQVIFYGVGMIMTAALHAHRRFGMPAVAPIFNNVVVIGVYVTYAILRAGEGPSVTGITTAQVWLLGAGTTAGVVAMTVCLMPSLRRLGWHFRFRFDLGHPAVRKGARLGAWALGYAGGYQAGLIVVLVLANRIEGGVAAYQWAFTFFYLPHALFGVPIFNVLFTAMAEHVSKGEELGIVHRVRDGLGMLGFMLVPAAAGLVVLAEPITRVTLEYGVMTRAGSDLVARVLMAFALGLPTYSLFLVLTRAFYALGDTKTPALINIGTVGLTMVTGTVLFFASAPRWSVAGLAFGHSIGFGIGSIAMTRALGRRVGRLLERAVWISLLRSVGAGAGAALLMWWVTSVLPAGGKGAALIELTLAASVGAVAYIGAMLALRSPEMARVSGTVRSFARRAS